MRVSNLVDPVHQRRVGFVGLGQMGGPIAANLVGAGHRLKVFGRRPAALGELASLGAETTLDIGDLTECDVLFLVLSDVQAVREVLTGDKGLLPRLSPGHIVVDLGTTDYQETVKISAEAAKHGVAFIDAPISGMEARARDGTLTLMGGGDQAVFNHITPLLRAFSNNIVYMGASGTGQLAKLVNQLLFDINVAAIAEILPMAVALGLKPDSVASVVNTGTGRSYASETFVPKILAGNFTGGYPLRSAYKDLVSAANLAAAGCYPLPVLGAATATYQQALLRGLGDLDKGAMIQVFEQLLSVKFRNEETAND